MQSHPCGLEVVSEGEKGVHVKTYIGHALDSQLRRTATSGGVGSALLKHLFSAGHIQTALSFAFDADTLKYAPRLIYKWEDYQPTGSIYQDMDLLGFLRLHIAEIRGTFACFCLPCQTASIRILLKRNGHDCFLLGLTCSSQQTLLATECLLDLLHVRKEDVVSLRYRGDGWPGGIRIERKNGESVFVKNNGSIWTDIFHSRLCTPERCLFCLDTLNQNADISLADPWLPEYRDRGTDGETLVVERTAQGEKILDEANSVCTLVRIPDEKAAQSQSSTIHRKEGYASHPGRRTLLLRLRHWPWYKKLVLSNRRVLKLHRKLLSRFKL